jgi:hypothetical protein
MSRSINHIRKALKILIIFLIHTTKPQKRGPCGYRGSIGPVSLTGVKNDPNKFAIGLRRPSSHVGFSLTFWVKITALPDPGDWGIIARYHNIIKLAIEEQGGAPHLILWAANGTPGSTLADVALSLDLWTLVWFEIDEPATPVTSLVVRDLASGQVNSVPGALSKSFGLFFSCF